MRVLGISGSLRRDSYNSRLLRAAGEIVEQRGAEFEVFDGLKGIPPYDEGTTTSVRALALSPPSARRSLVPTQCSSSPRSTTRRYRAC